MLLQYNYNFPIQIYYYNNRKYIFFEKEKEILLNLEILKKEEISSLKLYILKVLNILIFNKLFH